MKDMLKKSKFGSSSFEGKSKQEVNIPLQTFKPVNQEDKENINIHAMHRKPFSNKVNRVENRDQSVEDLNDDTCEKNANDKDECLFIAQNYCQKVPKFHNIERSQSARNSFMFTRNFKFNRKRMISMQY